MESSIAISPTRIWIARGLAVATDAVQIALLPATVEGVFSPLADGLDFVMAGALTLLVGWHIAFVPSFLVKLTPVGDLAPTWTMAVFIATRGRGRTPSPDDSALPLLSPSELNRHAWRPWYDTLKKPRWTPSSKTIGLIWTLLYPLIAFSFGAVFVQCARGKLPAWIALPFAINLLANLLFTPILFGLKKLWLATMDISIVLGTIVWAMIVVWPYSHLIAIAQVPYGVWVTIASVLQVSITIFNRE